MSENIDRNENREPFGGLHTLKTGSEQKLLSLLGFAAKARRITAGADLCRDAIRRGQAVLTIVASDASANTGKRILDACKYYESDMCRTTVTAAELGRRIGKSGDIAVVSVTDMNFANGISKLFDE